MLAKKIFNLLLTSALVLSTFAFSSTVMASCYSEDEDFYNAGLQPAKSWGVINGYPDGSFKAMLSRLDTSFTRNALVNINFRSLQDEAKVRDFCL